MTHAALDRVTVRGSETPDSERVLTKKILAYNDSSSFNWKRRHLDGARHQREVGGNYLAEQFA